MKTTKLDRAQKLLFDANRENFEQYKATLNQLTKEELDLLCCFAHGLMETTNSHLKTLGKLLK